MKKVDFHMDPSSFPTIVADQGVMNTRRLSMSFLEGMCVHR
jgi:hypothetical protein